MHKISNTPSKLPALILDTFNFGGQDGKDDPLLDSCALLTDPINEFIEGNKSIIVGDRGTGKTAIFRLLSERKIKFKSTGKYQQVYVPIDEELGYKTLREHVSSQVKDATKSGSTQHRIVWELFFLSRCLETLGSKIPSNTKFVLLKEKFYKSIGWSSQQKISLVDVLLHTKKRLASNLKEGTLDL